jgi:hypothetical protein
VSPVSRDLKVTGSIPTTTGTKTVVPPGATGVFLNVTPVASTAAGFISVRPANAAGLPTTSNVNFTVGAINPNAVLVELPVGGGDDGTIEITFDAFGAAGPTTDVLVDVVGYTTDTRLKALEAAFNHPTPDTQPTSHGEQQPDQGFHARQSTCRGRHHGRLRATTTPVLRVRRCVPGQHDPRASLPARPSGRDCAVTRGVGQRIWCRAKLMSPEEQAERESWKCRWIRTPEVGLPRAAARSRASCHQVPQQPPVPNPSTGGRLGDASSDRSCTQAPATTTRRRTTSPSPTRICQVAHRSNIRRPPSSPVCAREGPSTTSTLGRPTSRTVRGFSLWCGATEPQRTEPDRRRNLRVRPRRPGRFGIASMCPPRRTGGRSLPVVVTVLRSGSLSNIRFAVGRFPQDVRRLSGLGAWVEDALTLDARTRHLGPERAGITGRGWSPVEAQAPSCSRPRSRSGRCSPPGASTVT